MCRGRVQDGVGRAPDSTCWPNLGWGRSPAAVLRHGELKFSAPLRQSSSAALEVPSVPGPPDLVSAPFCFCSLCTLTLSRAFRTLGRLDSDLSVIDRHRQSQVPRDLNTGQLLSRPRHRRPGIWKWKPSGLPAELLVPPLKPLEVGVFQSQDLFIPRQVVGSSAVWPPPSVESRRRPQLTQAPSYRARGQSHSGRGAHTVG